MADSIGRGYVDGWQFQRVRSDSPRVGTGQLFSYTAYVEKGTGVDPVAFAEEVDAILADKRGWIRGGKVAFQRLASGRASNTQLVLATPDMVDKLCAPLDTEGEVSCCQGTKVVVNVLRWKNAVPHWTGRVKTYRQMLICHEFGHRLGKGHGYCPGQDQRAPVMQQQTYGLQGCKANSWPLASEL